MIAKGTNSTEGVYNGITEIEKVYKGTSLRYKNWVTKQGIPPLTLNKCRNANIKDYQVFGNSKQQLLPDGYTQLEYIESTGTQYIDTGVVPTSTSKASITFYSSKVAGSSYEVLISAMSNSNKNRFNMAIGQQNTPYCSFGMDNDVANFYIEVPNNTYVNQKLTYSLDATTKIGTCGNFNTTSTVNYNPPQISIFLLAYHYIMYNPDGFASGKLYEYNYTDNNYSQKLIPAKNSSNVVGMYDIVNDVFYTNAGTGNFIPGPVAPTPDAPIKIQSVGDNETGLPLGYTQLDYIQSTGTQYIDTGVLANGIDEFECDIQFLTTNDGRYGSMVGGDSRCYVGVHSNYFICSKSSTSYNHTVQSADTYRHKFKLTTTGFYIDDEKKENCSYVSTFVGPRNISLFALNGNAISYYSSSKCFGFKASRNGTLVRNMIPCKNSNNVIGMYDTVTNAFFTNAGTGDFIAGNEIGIGGYKIPINVIDSNNVSNITNIYLNEPLRKIGDGVPQILPSGYTQLEYIQSTGTQYIDTGIVADNNTGVKLEASFSDVTSDMVRFGSRTTTGDTRFTIGSINGYIYFGWGSIISNNTYSVSTNTKYTIKLNHMNNRKAQYGNYNQMDITSDLPTQTYNTLLFAHNRAGTITYSSYKLYGCEITSGQNIIRKFIPCKNSSNVVGMYDTVTGTFFENAGTGTFTAGLQIYADYIDFEAQKVYRNVIVNDDSGQQTIENSYSGTTDTTGTTVTLPDILLNKGTNIVSVDTTTTPSNMWIKYKGKEQI